ncbi:TPA: plasmid recombination protein [Clostridium perfringens]|uniref:MobV family relaxase n=2 Tax=Clostridium perfringens TaxID=1502 RepID=UPI001B81DF07|nr:plasmid recombination protein [Clostridium perfringens]HBC2035117.1 plasmid recombination protein [Clostridium perfringens]HBC2058261.1 plasmid recombination protein [Clostridium perfringens]HBC2072471.1 plasmid recombination protein [Clostridium perfringens]
MSYLVCHFGKYKSGNVFGLQKHNQRENKNYSNIDLDISKSHLNYDLINSKPINFRNTINSLIKEKRKSDKAIRKDAVVYCECIISSDQKFFKNLSADRQKLFFRESLEFLGKKLGKENIISANVHLDETTPHMHVGFVPIHGTSLSAKKVLNRNFLRDIHDKMPKFLKENGFDIERGKENAKIKHLETKDFKRTYQSELNNLENEKIKLDKDIISLENKREAIRMLLNDAVSYENLLKDINDLEVGKTLIGAKITIKNDDYIKLKEKFKFLTKENIKKDNEILELKNLLEEKKQYIKSLNKMYDSLDKTLGIRNSEIFDIKENVSKEKEKEIKKIRTTYENKIEFYEEEVSNYKSLYKAKYDEVNLMQKFIRQHGLQEEYLERVKIEKRKAEVKKLEEQREKEIKIKLEERNKKDFLEIFNKPKEREFEMEM